MRVYFDRRTGWWVMDYRDATGRRRRVRAGLTKAAALAVQRKRMHDVALEEAGEMPHMESITLKDYSRRFLEWAKAHKKPTTARRYESSIDQLLPKFGRLLLKEISPRAVESYMTERIEAGAKPATVNRDVACLKRLFSKGVEWNVCRETPLRRVRLLREQNARVRYLSDDERKALLDACKGHLRDAVMLALYAGMRKGEILGLRWEDIDLDRGQITVRETKNGEIRHIPIASPLLTHLERIPRRLGCPHLFAGTDGTPFQDIDTTWQAARDRAGLKDFRFHDLRHTFASYMAMSGVGLEVIQALLGHKTPSMTLRYAHLSPDYLRASVEKMAGQMARGIVQTAGNGTQKAQAQGAG